MALAVAAAFALLSLVRLPQASANSCSGALQTLSIQLPKASSPEFAGFVVPTTDVAGPPKYTDECLTVQIRQGGPQTDPLEELRLGNTEVALAEGAQVAKVISDGSQALTVIAGYYQHSALALVALQSIADNLQEFVFKTVGMRTSGDDLAVQAMLALNNVASSVNMAQQSPYLAKLADGTLDFATVLLNDDFGYILRWLDPNTHFLWQESDLTVFKTADHGAPALHHVLVVETSKLADIRDKLVRFLRVVTKAWLYCRDNEATCVSGFRHAGLFQHWQMREANRLVFPSADGPGVISSQKWAAITDPLVTSNLIQSIASPVNNSLLGEANNFTGSDEAKSAFDAGSLNFCAPLGSATPLSICSGHEHMLCSEGYEPPSSSGACVACPAGKFFANPFKSSASRMNACTTCPVGRYASASAATECAQCQPGTYRSGSMQASSCMQCAKGKAAAIHGMTECDECPRGRYASTAQKSECAKCPDGKFAGTVGATACETCADNTTTLGSGAMYAHECACPANMYRQFGTRSCLHCPTGFQCPLGSDESVLRSFADPGFTKPSGEYPHLLPGYWASKADPLSVYICHDVDSCPGGPPESCAPHMVDLACGLCAEGYFRQGQVCEQCTGNDERLFNYPTLPTFAGLLLVIVLYNIMQDTVEQWGHWSGELWSMAYLMLVYYQIVGLVVISNVPWPSRIKGTLYGTEYFVDVSEKLRLSCVGNGTFRAFRDAYLVRWTAPMFLLACFLIIWVFGLILAELGIAVRKSKGRWLDSCFKNFRMRRFLGKVPPKLAVNPSVLFNSFMALIFAFYICLNFVALIPFMCYESPNGKKLLRFGPTMHCDSSDWDAILAEAVIGIIVYIALCIGGLMFVAAAAPSQFNSKGFRSRWKFLFIKFRPDVWWWGVVLLVRALLLNLAQVLSQEGERHLIWIMVIVFSYTAGLVFLRPWRGTWANVLDIWMQGSLLLFIGFGATFVTRTRWLDDSVAHFAIFITFLPIIVTFMTICWVIACAFPVVKENMEELPNKRLSDDVQAAFAKFVGLDQKAAQTFVKKLSEFDRRVLLRAWFIVAAELVTVGQRPSWVKQTPGLLIRPKKELKEEVVEEGEDIDEIDVNDKDGYVPKWKQNPPNRRSPKPASQAGPDVSSDKLKEQETARTNTTAAASQGGSQVTTSQSTGNVNIHEPTDHNAIRAQIA